MNTCTGCQKEYKTEKGLSDHVRKCEKVAAPFSPVKVERKKSKRGRPVREMPGMDDMIQNWDQYEVEGTYPLPDHEGNDSHSDVTLSRYHFRKRANKIGLVPGQDFTIESHPDCGATITKLR